MCRAKVYFACAPCGEILKKQTELPDNIVGHCMKYKLTDDKNRSFAAWKLLFALYKSVTGKTLESVEFENDGKPVACVPVSLSHSENAVMAAFSTENMPLGADIESAKRKLSEKAAKLLNAEKENAVEKWTKRECVIKAVKSTDAELFEGITEEAEICGENYVFSIFYKNKNAELIKKDYENIF